MVRTKKLLEGLGGDGVTVRSLADWTRSAGVYVSLKCSRQRGTIPLPPQLIGVAKMKDAAKEAYANYVSLGRISFIPAEDEARLMKVESAIRYQLGRRTVSNGFMPLSKYDTFKVEFMDAKFNYFVERDRILSNWDTLVRSFTEAVTAVVEESSLLQHDKDKLCKEILEKIPSKEAYANSFSMSLVVQTFPAQPDVQNLPQELSADVLNTWKDTVLENAVECISSLAQEVFDMCSGVAAKYADRGNINGNSLNGLIVMGQRIVENNLFRNPTLKEASDLLKSLQTIAPNAVDEQEEVVENVLIALYQYSVETGMELTMPKRGLSKANLEAMIKLRNGVSKSA